MNDTPYRQDDYDRDRVTLGLRPDALLVPAGLRLRRNKLARGSDAASVARIDAAYGRLLNWLEASSPALEQDTDPVEEPVPEPVSEPESGTTQDDSAEAFFKAMEQGMTGSPPVSAAWQAELDAQRQRYLRRRAPPQTLELEGPKVTILPPGQTPQLPAPVKPKGWFRR